jgi:hypothetical protein
MERCQGRERIAILDLRQHARRQTCQLGNPGHRHAVPVAGDTHLVADRSSDAVARVVLIKASSIRHWDRGRRFSQVHLSPRQPHAWHVAHIQP